MADGRCRVIAGPPPDYPTPEVVPLQPRFFDAAADLLCRQYRALRDDGLTVPARLFDRELP